MQIFNVLAPVCVTRTRCNVLDFFHRLQQSFLTLRSWTNPYVWHVTGQKTRGSRLAHDYSSICQLLDNNSRDILRYNWKSLRYLNILVYSEISRGTSSEVLRKAAWDIPASRITNSIISTLDSVSRQWSEFWWIRLVQGSVAGPYGYDTSLWGKFGDGMSDHQLLNKDSAAWYSNKMPLCDVILPVRSTEL